MLTRRDENLLARDFIGPIRIWHSLGFQKTQICSAMRLGQVHCACPFTGNHFRKISVFLLVRAANLNRFTRAVGQARIHGKGHVGRRLHFTCRNMPDARHAHAPIFRTMGEAHHAIFDDLLIGVFKACGRCDRPIVMALTAFMITHNIQRGEDLRCEFAAFFQNRV